MVLTETGSVASMRKLPFKDADEASKNEIDVMLTSPRGEIV